MGKKTKIIHGGRRNRCGGGRGNDGFFLKIYDAEWRPKDDARRNYGNCLSYFGWNAKDEKKRRDGENWNNVGAHEYNFFYRNQEKRRTTCLGTVPPLPLTDLFDNK